MILLIANYYSLYFGHTILRLYIIYVPSKLKSARYSKIKMKEEFLAEILLNVN